MKSSIDSLRNLSIHIAIPFLFFIALLFLYIQIYVISIPQAIEIEKNKSKEHLLGALTSAQATLTHLYATNSTAAVKQEIKLMNIDEKQIKFAVIYNEEREIITLSHRQFREEAIEKINAVMGSSGFHDFRRFHKPYIILNSGYTITGVIPIDIPVESNMFSKADHHHLMIVYTYDNEVLMIKKMLQNIFNISLLIAVLLFSLMAYLFYIYFIKKINALQKASRKIASGEYGVQIPVKGFIEVQNIIRTFNSMSTSLKSDILQIKQAEQNLRYEKETAQNYLDIVGVMILVLDNHFNVKVINQRGCEIIGYHPEEVIGKNWLKEFLPEHARSDVLTVAESLTGPASNKIHYHENPVVTKSGEERLIAWRNTTLFDDHGEVAGILTSGEDITEMRSVEKQLQNSEHFFRSVFTSVNEAIFILDENIIVDCNDMMLQLYEKEKSDLVGKNVLQIGQIHCHASSFESILNDAKGGQAVETQCFITLDADNEDVKIVEITLSPFGESENKVIGIMRDITERVEQERLFKLHSRQAQMGEMISMIAHQWRQPLTSISAITTQMTLGQLMNDRPDPEMEKNLKDIEEQVAHLSQTITDFRDFFRPDKPKESVTLSDLVQQSIELMDHTIKSSDVNVAVTTVKDTDIVTYRNEVLQVLMTLLKNSLDAFSDNYITDRHIDVSVDHSEDYAKIAIHDNAGGIDATIISDIFLPYFTTKDENEGTGLGLYMSKMVIEEHCRGQLNVESGGSETTFTIKLPLEDV